MPDFLTGVLQGDAANRAQAMGSIQQAQGIMGLLSQRNKVMQEQQVQGILSQSKSPEEAIGALMKAGPLGMQVAGQVAQVQQHMTQFAQSQRAAQFNTPANLQQYMTGGSPGSPSPPDPLGGGPAQPAVPGQLDSQKYFTGAVQAGAIAPLDAIKQQLAYAKQQEDRPVAVGRGGLAVKDPNAPGGYSMAIPGAPASTTPKNVQVFVDAQGNQLERDPATGLWNRSMMGPGPSGPGVPGPGAPPAIDPARGDIANAVSNMQPARLGGDMMGSHNLSSIIDRIHDPVERAAAQAAYARQGQSPGVAMAPTAVAPPAAGPQYLPPKAINTPPVPLSAEDLKSAGAQHAMGMPLTLVVPGYGSKGVVNDRNATRAEAIRQIKAEVPFPMSSEDAGKTLATRQATYAAGRMGLGQLVKQETMVGAFEKNASLNATLALQFSDKVDRSGVPVFNRWILAGKKEVLGDPDVTKFNTANYTFINEYAKVVSGSMGNTAITDSARNHANDVLSTSQTKEQYKQNIALLKTEMDNRMIGFAQQKQQLVNSLGNGSPVQGAPGSAIPTSAVTGAPPAAPSAWKVERVQ